MNKLYSVHDHWTDINKKNDVDIESIDGVIAGIKVNGEDYGGTSWTEIFSGDVVTSGEAAPFIGTINANLSGSDTIKVVYNNTEYILPKQVTDYGIFYGAPAAETPGNIDFSKIPFIIDWGEVSRLYTQSPGPQAITILEPQSGGGESDFSTAHVTITNNSSKEILFYIPVYWHIPDGSTIESFLLTDDEMPTFEGEVVIPTNGKLYVGSSLAQFTTGNTSVTGNATVEKGLLIITGDCTITIS